MSLLIENFENAFNSYATAWKEEPVKMAAGHLTAAATIGAVIYYRKDISQAASKTINDVQSLIASSKTFNKLSNFVNTAKSTTLTKFNVVKDVTASKANIVKDFALTKLNVVKDGTSALAKKSAATANATKEFLATATSNGLSSTSNSVKAMAQSVKSKFV